ncbi:MAG: YdgA family protein [Gammaproteobacteria bacterium]|nr:YdgA family protein [Gammaproteobacteria bacterium]
MRRTGLIVVVLLILVGALAGLPYWFGMQAETAYNEVVQRITKAKDGEVSIGQSQYERGWFSSTAEMTLTSNSLPISVAIVSKIHHGPFPQIEELSFEPMMAFIKSQASIPDFKTLPPIDGRTAIAFDGASRTQVTLPAHKTPWGDVEWKPITGEIAISADRKKSKSSFLVPEISMTTPFGKPTITKLAITVDEHEHASGASLVDFNLTVDKLGMGGDNPGSGMDGLRVAVKNDIGSGNLLAINFNTEVRAFRDGDVSHGPGALAVQLRKLDMAALSAYQTQMRELKKQKNPEKTGMASMGKFMELLANLAKKAPEFELSKFSLKTGGGEITGKAKFVLNGTDLNLVENPALFVTALQGDAEFKLPAGVVKQRAEKAIRTRLETYKLEGKLTAAEAEKLTPERMTAIVEQALPKEMQATAEGLWLVPDEADYKFTLAFQQGQLTVNGKPFDKPLRLPN